MRDTLGLLITSIMRGGPAEKAGLEEGNRLAAINGVSLRANAADIDDYESAGTLSRRLVRELEKAKPGDEVELRVYREGRTQNMRVRTVSSDSLFKRTTTFRRVSRDEMDDRPALGIGLGSTGSRRDTLGVLVMSVQDSSPAARAGLEEGNRIAAINGVNLRVAHEDADDPSLGRTKAQRLMREVSQLKPGDNVTMRVYANGQFRDVTMKVARAGDLPRSRGMTYFGGVDFPAMPPMPRDACHAGDAARRRSARWRTSGPIRMEVGPECDERLDGVRVQLDGLRPELERIRTEVPRALEGIEVPNVQGGVGAGEDGAVVAECGMRGLADRSASGAQAPGPSRTRALRIPHRARSIRRAQHERVQHQLVQRPPPAAEHRLVGEQHDVAAARRLVDEERRAAQQALGVARPGEAGAHERARGREDRDVLALLRRAEKEVALEHHGEARRVVAGGEPVRAVEQHVGVDAGDRLRRCRARRRALVRDQLLRRVDRSRSARWRRRLRRAAAGAARLRRRRRLGLRRARFGSAATRRALVSADALLGGPRGGGRPS